MTAKERCTQGKLDEGLVRKLVDEAVAPCCVRREAGEVFDSQKDGVPLAVEARPAPGADVAVSSATATQPPEASAAQRKPM